MNKPRNKGLVIGLIVCFALAVIIPNIFLFVFGGFEAANKIIGLVLGILFISVLIGVYYSLCGLAKGLTVSPVSPTYLMRLIYEVLGKELPRKRRGAENDDSSSENRHPKVRKRPYSRTNRG